ncbi:translation initiation factor IF-3 [Microdochium nivale]|nr:translation initiation factor IF-3 [Microdochium nivale]
MQPYRCPFSPSRALQRVFLAGWTLSSSTTSAHTFPVAARAVSTLAAFPSSAITPRSRNTNLSSATASQQGPIPGCRGYAKLVRAVKPNQKPQVYNDDIPYQWVLIKQDNKPNEDGDEDGGSSSGGGGGGIEELGPPQRTDVVLRNLDLDRFRLVMLAPPPPPRDGLPNAAICKLVDLEAEARRRTADKKEARKEKVNTKELEFNWAIAKGDLDTKLGRLAEFLRKGMRVEVMLAKKRGSRIASVKEAEQLVQYIRDAVAEVPHAKEVKKIDGQIGKVARLAFEGPGKKLRDQLLANAAQVEARAQAKADEDASQELSDPSAVQQQ